MNDPALSPWLPPLLAAAHPSRRFREACRRAAQEAGSVALLRLARQQRAPGPVGVRSYLTQLAREAGVPLAEVPGWPALNRPLDAEAAGAWGRLAAAMG